VITFIFTTGVTQNMNTFKRKALASAVLGTLGIAGSAHAIYQDPNNLGQALVYPYYTVNNDPNGNPFNTYISIVNTNTDVKVVKVRFREGKASHEVLDFNLYLSPNDVWTGAIIPASTDTTSAAHIVTADVSCTNPVIPAGGVDFRNFDYAGDVLAQDTLDRTREGYAEVFEMATIDPTAGTGVWTAAVHQYGTGGAPACGAVLVGNPAGGGAVLASVTYPTGGLSGTGTLINVTSGRDTMYNARAFGAWLTGTQAYNDPTTDNPNFGNTSPPSSIVVDPGKARAYFSNFVATVVQSGLTLQPGARAAAATMMHDNVINEYILDAVTGSDTDLVMTFPTKKLFVFGTAAITPFTNSLTKSGACEVISVTYFNREEVGATPSGVDFSPSPGAAPANTLCWESTVMSIRNGSTNAPTPSAAPTSLVLGSRNVTAVSVSSAFQNGWMRVNFTGTNAVGTGLTSDATSTTVGAAGIITTAAQTYHGLPVVGFMVRTYANGTLTCGTASCLGNYMGSVGHAFTLNVTP
jgi:hypothetical protein